jgi:Holliday junction resolvase
VTYRKVDSNQRIIVSVLRTAGASVISLASVGKGCPDLLVGFRGLNFLIEIKNPEGKDWITPLEQNFLDGWRGQVVVARTIDDALNLLGIA